ncbi:MAG: porin [Coraliomargarita sp.]
MNTPSRILSLTALAAATPFAASASETLDALESNIEKVWKYAKLYENEDNSIIQKVAFTGRLQYDYAYYDNEETSHIEENEWRRARAGFKVDFLNEFQAHAEMDMDFNDHDPVYNRLTDAYIAWKPNSDLKIKVGKQSAGFTLDGATSSKKLYRAERSLIGSNIWFGTEYFVGATVAGKHDNWNWKGGLFSNTRRQEFDNTFDGSWFTLASVGYNFADALEVDNATLRLDYVHQDEASNSESQYTHSRDNLENIVSLSFKYDDGKKHLHTDLAYADELDGNDIFALQIMPFYDLTERFQVVGSYTYIENDDGGLRVSRYARRAGTAGNDPVDEIHEFYFGLNTYLYGHKVKWQNGIEYATTNDDEYEGLGFTSAIRLSW